MMEITLDTKGLEQVKNIIRSSPNTIAQALNETARGMTTDAAREIRVHYTVKAAPVRDKIKMKRKATSKLLQTGIMAKGRALSLIHFSVLPSKPVYEGGSRPKVGPSVRVKKGSDRSKASRSFVARKRNTGELAVLRRKGRARRPIREMWGPGTATMLGQEGVSGAVLRKVKPRLEKNVERRVNLALAKAGLL